MGSYFSAGDISASGLSAERVRMQVIANNVANAHTTRTSEGGPFRRQTVTFTPEFQSMVRSASGNQLAAGGVRVAGIQPDMTELPEIYDPGHPDANELGFVQLPNIQIANEMVDMITASRSYEANLQAIQSLKEMIQNSISLLRGV